MHKAVASFQFSVISYKLSVFSYRLSVLMWRGGGSQQYTMILRHILRSAAMDSAFLHTVPYTATP